MSFGFILLLFLGTFSAVYAADPSGPEAETKRLIELIGNSKSPLENRTNAITEVSQSREMLLASKGALIQVVLTVVDENPREYRAFAATTLAKLQYVDFSVDEIGTIARLASKPEALPDVRYPLASIFLASTSPAAELVIRNILVAKKDARFRSRILEVLQYRTQSTRTLKDTMLAVLLDVQDDPEVRNQAGVALRSASGVSAGDLSRLIPYIRNRLEATKIRSTALTLLHIHHYSPQALTTLMVEFTKKEDEAPDVRATAIEVAGRLDAHSIVDPVLFAVAKNSKDLPGIRATAIRALASSGGSQEIYLATFTFAMRDIREQPAVRSAALEYVAKFRSEEELALIVFDIIEHSINGAQLRVAAIRSVRDHPLWVTKEHARLLVRSATSNDETQEVRLAALDCIASVAQTTSGLIVSSVPRLYSAMRAEERTQPSSKQTREYSAAIVQAIVAIANAAKKDHADQIVRYLTEIIDDIPQPKSPQSGDELWKTRQQLERLVSEARQNIRTDYLEASLKLAKDYYGVTVPILAYVFWFAILSGLWVFSPWRIIVVRCWLQGLDMTVPVLGGFPVPTSALGFTWVAARSDRVLKAIISRNISNISAEFEGLESVRKRRIWVPVAIEWPDKISQPEVTRFFAHFRDKIHPLVIVGEGGAGKSSLAFEVVRWVIAGLEEFKSAQMIPVVIEGTPEFPTVKDNLDASMLEMIGRKVQTSLRLKYQLDSKLIGEMLRKKKIAVVVDGFSEMTPESRKRIPIYSNSLQLNAVIVTSRQNEFTGEQKTLVRARALDGAAVTIFIENYLKKIDKANLFAGKALHDLCGQLDEIVGHRSITPLLARIYVDHSIAQSQIGKGTGQIKTIPGLYNAYLTETVRQAAPPVGITEQAIRKFVLELAWNCVQENLQSGSAKREALANMASAPTAKEVDGYLDFLDKKAGLVARNLLTDTVTFQFDPAAEYFAATYLVSHSKQPNQTITAICDQLETDTDRGGKLDFADAILDCIEAYAPNDRSMDTIRPRLSKILSSRKNSAEAA